MDYSREQHMTDSQNESSTPDKLVVLTFDDGAKSMITFVAPLLKKMGFGATFYVTDDPRFQGEHYLTWEECKELSDQGFEIGNHLKRHVDITTETKEELIENIEHIEKRCEEQGIPRPVTFCYPGYDNNLDAVRVLTTKGYLFARRGADPEYPQTDNGDRGSAYDPHEDHPLLVPTTGASGPNWDFDDLVWAVDRAKEGKIAVLTFHGVPDIEHPWVNTEQDDFTRYMEYLKEQGCTVVALRDLDKYVDPALREIEDPYSPIKRRLMLTPTDLRCEYLENPLGIDRIPPHLSWSLESKKRGSRQTAYRILVAESEEGILAGEGIMRDSGKIESDQTSHVSYEGGTLQSRKKYWWKVQVWDEEAQSIGFSPPATFVTGILNQTEWKARWIGADKEISSPLLRKELALDGIVTSALAYFSGIGWSELYINGAKVGDRVLDPAHTDYHKSIVYVTHDITELLVEGDNVIGIMLGNGWFSEPGWSHPYGDSPQALLLLDITYLDGRSVTIKTDSTWKTSPGPITQNDLWNGEVYDARLEQLGWAETGFDDSSWEPVSIKDRSRGVIKSQLMPPIRVNQTMKPLELHNPQPGVFVFHFGQLFGGWVRLRAKGPAGTEITVKYSARLDADSGLLDVHRHEKGSVSDTYIMKGEGKGEEYEPRFTYHPVRYVQIEGYPGTPTLEDVEGCVVYSSVDLSGGFSSSNPLLNKIHKAVLWTVTNGLFGLPLDCLYREHWAWIDPATITGNLFPRKFMPEFWVKWLEDIRESQFENGGVPDVAPNYWQRTQEDPAWGGNYPILVWYLYRYFGDKRILEEHYQGIKKQVEYLETMAENLLLVEGHFGDHMLPGSEPGTEEFISSETPRSLVWTGYFYRAAIVMAEAARVLGKEQEADHFGELAEQIRDAFNKEWLNGQKGVYATGSQTANLFPLALGIVPEETRDILVRNTVDDIYNKYDGHHHTGNTGTTCMLTTLSDYDNGEALYDVVTVETYPGWGYMIAEGATTIWEGWSLGAKAGNAESMIMWATIDEFFYNDLAGIKGPKYYGPDSFDTAFGTIDINPFIPDDLDHAGAHIKTISGQVSSKWKKTKEGLTFDVLIPPNTAANVTVPILDIGNPVIQEAFTTVWKEGSFVPGVGGISGAEKLDGKKAVSFSLSPGYYRFSVGKVERSPYQ